MKRPLRLLISAEVSDRVRQLHPDLKRKVRASLDALLQEPLSGRPLQGDLLGFHSARVGKFRVVYRLLRDGVDVLTIGPRRTVYEEAERLAARSRRRGGS